MKDFFKYNYSESHAPLLIKHLDIFLYYVKAWHLLKILYCDSFLEHGINIYATILTEHSNFIAHLYYFAGYAVRLLGKKCHSSAYCNFKQWFHFMQTLVTKVVHKLSIQQPRQTLEIWFSQFSISDTKMEIWYPLNMTNLGHMVLFRDL